MKFRYDGDRKVDLVMREQAFACEPGQVLDVPFAINNPLFTPLDLLADMAQAEYRKEWQEWPAVATAEPVATEPAEPTEAVAAPEAAAATDDEPASPAS